LQVLAESAVTTTTDAVSKVKVTTSSLDSNLKNNTDVSNETVKSDPATATSAGPRGASKKAASNLTGFSGLTYQFTCGAPGSGNQGEGYIGANLSLEEYGKSGTTHFTLDWRVQELDDSGDWSNAGLSQTLPSQQFPNDATNYYWIKSHSFSFDIGDDGETFRLQVRAKWVHDNVWTPDKVLKTAGWVTGPTCTADGE
jgi:hypothetical protein